MIIWTTPDALGLGSLDLSLKPPKWLRTIASTVASSGAVKVTVPTASGPIEVNRDTLNAAIEALKNTRVAVNAGGGPRTQPPMEQVQDFVQSRVPGGWFTVLGVGLAGVVFLATRHKHNRKGSR